MPILIKRYANRKLYNTQASRYITLKGISELLNAGEEVRVIDNETGEDITNVALSQILVDSERKNSALPRSLLSQIVERGGDVLYGALKKGMDDASEGVTDIQDRVFARSCNGERETDGPHRLDRAVCTRLRVAATEDHAAGVRGARPAPAIGRGRV